MSETAHSGLSDNAIGAIAYITCIPAIVFLVMPPYNASPFVRFHSWQSIFLDVAAFVFWVVMVFTTVTMFFLPHAILVISRSIWLAWILVWILCVVNTLNGKRFKLPLVGGLAEKQAGA
jgi:uncharacterized membrane protein